MRITFEKFVKKYLDLPYEIPEYMKSFIKGMEGNKRYCICLHKHYGRNTFKGLFKEYEKYLESE